MEWEPRLAPATKNPAGVIYQSWKNDEGSMVQLEKNQTLASTAGTCHPW
jgi:hypothetical protein